MVAYTFYETDFRVKKYAETLVCKGAKVDVIALRRYNQSPYSIVNGVNVYKIQKRLINEKGKLSYAIKLLNFLLKSTIVITKKWLKYQYDIIHVHNVPDFEVFAAIIPKLSGSKIILDIHDILPEFYASKFSIGNNSMIYRMLLMMEKTSAKFADYVIVSNHLWKKKLVSRSVDESKCITILNYPELKIFKDSYEKRKNKNFIILYPGTLNWHQGLDIAIKSFSLIKDKVPEVKFYIYGEGPEKMRLNHLIHKLEVQDNVFLKEFLPIEKIIQVMANASLGVVPKRSNRFGNEAFSTKILEFMALGVPVIVSATEIDRYYFDNSIVRFFRPGDIEDLAQSMLILIKDKKLRNSLAKNAYNYINKNNWEVKKSEYLEIINSLIKK